MNADVTLPSDEGGWKQAYERWATHLIASGIPEERAWLHFQEWAEEDTYFPLQDELAALEAAGFRARCTWKQNVSTVVVAEK